MGFRRELAKDFIRTSTHETARVIGWFVGSLIVGFLAGFFVSPEVGVGSGGLLALLNPFMWRG